MFELILLVILGFVLYFARGYFTRLINDGFDRISDMKEDFTETIPQPFKKENRKITKLIFRKYKIKGF